MKTTKIVINGEIPPHVLRALGLVHTADAMEQFEREQAATTEFEKCGCGHLKESHFASGECGFIDGCDCKQFDLWSQK